MCEKHLPPLSHRMQTAAEMVTAGSRAADVGCDHGYVSIWLYLSGRAAACIAMDINPGPLGAAGRNVRLYGAQEGVAVRLSDGLQALQKGEADSLLITGMGGMLIRRILAESGEKLADFREMILEPQSEPEQVRVFLEENGFHICEEKMICESGKYYPVIRAVPGPGAEPMTETERLYGPVLMRSGSPVFAEFLKKEKNRLLAALRELEKNGSASAKVRADELKEKLEQVHEAEQFL